jgi:superfamily II DNA or RNA helicase/HKD family nuclease
MSKGDKMAENLPDGLYDLLISDDLHARLDLNRARSRPLDNFEAWRLAEALHRQLVRILDDMAAGDSIAPQLQLVNSLLVELRKLAGETASTTTELVAEPPRVLTSIAHHGVHPEPPKTGLLAPWLFTAGRDSPSLLSELRRELVSTDQVDILVSFITVSGVRKMRDILHQVTNPGADEAAPMRIRVLTTTYIGATEMAAVDELANLPGCEVRISLDGRRTRLHAKAWIFRRATGFGSAYVGSANLSGAAMAGGLEWTVKITERQQEALHARAIAHFDTLWEDPEFQAYDPRNEAHRSALSKALSREGGEQPTSLLSFFDIEPKNYQKEMLEQLEIEREHGRNRNLVVAATGTGKTVVAAFDYRNICRKTGGRPRILFVAHRRQILLQALRTYREVLRDGEFGQLLSGVDTPARYDHLFATIDSLTSRNVLTELGNDFWHTVVIDECHRIAANRFDALATRIKPKLLLGLTATPERTDGRSIMSYFDARSDGGASVEMRLWHALDLQLLAPFEYYACEDNTDFSEVRWNNVGEQQAISGLVSNNDVRARTILNEWRRLAADPRSCKALAFCVSVDHALFMTRHFEHAGLPVVCVHGGTSSEEREQAINRLRKGELCALVTVDLFNEGVDVPEVDTLLLLRPTQSALLFQQQLGRGLRLSKGKESCLVLDFVGHHNTEFRYDRLLGSITGLSKRQLKESVEHGFSALPVGCHIQLQHQVRNRILESLSRQINSQWRHLKAELTSLAALQGREPTLGQFLREQSIDLGEVYRNSGSRGWTNLRRDAGLLVAEPGPEETYLSERLSNLCHRDALDHIEILRKAADLATEGGLPNAVDAHRLQILAYQIDGTRDRIGDPESFLTRLGQNPAISEELRQLADVLEQRVLLSHVALPGLEETSLLLHASYELREILTAVGVLTATSRPLVNTGVHRVDDLKLELMFVTLDKSNGYHEGIAYHDYAISPTRFHWQSQNSAGPETGAGRRYLEGATNGWQFQLFVRSDRQSAYVACGPATLIESTGARPMNIVWQLDRALPASLFQRFSVLRG